MRGAARVRRPGGGDERDEDGGGGLRGWTSVFFFRNAFRFPEYFEVKA